MSSKPHHEADQDEIEKKQDGSFVFHPRAFNIIWGNDQRYWRMPEKGNKEGAADLVQVCWLELTGSTKDPLPLGKYSIKFKISMKQDAFGWNGCPVFMMAKVGKRGKYKWTKIDLSNLPQVETDIPNNFEIDVTSNADDSKLYFGLYEVWAGKWKGGLVIHEAKVEKVPT